MSGKSKELVRLLAMPRGKKGEELRLSLDEFEPDDGNPAQYVSLRVWFRGNDKMLPSKTGITVRRGELRRVIEALTRAEKILDGKESAANKGGPAVGGEPFDMGTEDREGLF